MKTKGQIDMFGLVIIVILIVMIGLFSLFFISRGQIDEREEYYSYKANNFANALSKYSRGNLNFKEMVLECCTGSRCEDLLDFVEDNFAYVDEPVSFEIECANSDYSGSRGSCSSGIASESIILQSGDLIRVNLCRK
ncbi:hypothetical protein HOG16_01000 [Candidatus Woesearchaeota archaeon]|nr:hypothetical protein [Candidatus Woesearchaeota archaeon]MBT4322071.1 hypothetical protein [Candidatus Woesearchaeota archaeon]MBT4630648.1 hypothetical protein [Candidatus Woesearchaeota archaeon]